MTVTVAHGTAESATTIYQYDLRDWRDKIMDPLNRETEFEYFLTQRVKKITDPLLRETDFTYDADGNRTSVTTHGETHTAFTSDEWGNPSTMTDPDEKTVTYGFNSFGEQVNLKNRRNNTYLFEYNANWARETVTTPLTHTTTTEWNDRNLIDYTEKARTPTIRATFVHDDRRRVYTVTDPLGQIVFGWDDNGNLETVTEGSDVITRDYDSADRIESYSDAGNGTVGYKWYDNGLLKEMTYPGNRQVTYTYYETNRLKTVTDWANRVTTYHWSDAGELTGIDRPNNVNRVNQHDDASQLRRIYERDAAGNLLAYFRFGFDDDGRMDWRYRLPKPQAINLPAIDATYDDDNRINTWGGTTVVHDDDGNMTTGPLFGHGFTNYVYDVRDRLTSAGGVSYGYDSENNRTSLTTTEGTTNVLFDPNAGGLPRVLIRENPDLSTTTYVYGLGLLYEVDDNGDATYYPFDHIGSTAMLTNEAGEVTDRVEYSPWGDITHREGETETPFLFVGQHGVQTDFNGLLHMRARYYSPELRRFVTADPIGFEGGLNWYGYANGNPMMFIDPSGLYPGEYVVDYWHGAIMNPANGTVGGSVIAGIEGASSGAGAWFDGFVPVWNPFDGNYQEGNFTTDTIRMVGAGTRELAISTGGAAFAQGVVRASGAAAVARYESWNPIAQAGLNRLILTQAFTASGRLGEVQQVGNLFLQGVSIYDTVRSGLEYRDRVYEQFSSNK